MAFGSEINAFWVGLLLGSASVVSVGPNSLMIMREGLARGRVSLVTGAVCLSFFALLSLSQSMAGMLEGAGPGVRLGLAWSGVGFITYQAVKRLRSAFSPRVCELPHLDQDAMQCLRRVLLFVWTNPLTYLERLIIPAAVGQSFATAGQREEFVVALMIVAAAGCVGYACLGKVLGIAIRHEQRVRLFDLASGVVVLVLAFAASAKLLSGGI